MANTVITEIYIVCNDAAVLNEIMEKYTTNGGLDFNKICPMPEDIKTMPSFSTTVVQAISRYLSIINPNNKAYEGHPLRQKYKMVCKEEMADILEDLKRYGDPGLSSLLQINLPPDPENGDIFSEQTFVYGNGCRHLGGELHRFIDIGMEYVCNIRNYSVPNAELWMERLWGTRSNAKTVSKCEIIDNVLRTRIETIVEPRKIIAMLEGKYPTCKIDFDFKFMTDASSYIDAARTAGLVIDNGEYNNQ